LVGQPLTDDARETDNAGGAVTNGSFIDGGRTLAACWGCTMRPSSGMMALLTSSGISSSLYSVESSDEGEVRTDWACTGSLSASGFFWFRLGLVRPEGLSGLGHSSPRRLSVSEETDFCES
jgi:hypothetical protein